MRGLLGRVLTKGATVVSLVSAFVAGATWRITDRYLSLVSDGYRKNAVVYACIRLLAQSLPEPPLTVYRTGKGGEEADPKHPLRALIARPNPYQTEFEFWELTATNLSLVGRAHWWKERDKGGRPIGLWPLRPDRVAPILGRDPLVAGWAYHLDGQVFTLPAADVLTFNYPDPADETGGVVGGLGPLQVLAREVDTDNEATTFVFRLLANYAMPGTVIKTKRSLTPEQAKEFKEKFAQRYGELHRGEPAVVDADTEITPLSHTLRDLEFPDVRSLGESRIAAGFGVPAILVGLKVGLDRSTFANMAEAREFFAQTTLSVLWRRLADQIELDLLPEFDRAGTSRCAFDTSGVRALQAQVQQRVQRYATAYTGGAITVNEYRTQLALPPLAGGDVLVRPVNLVEIPAAAAAPSRAKAVIDATATVADPRDGEVPALPAGRFQELA